MTQSTDNELKYILDLLVDIKADVSKIKTDVSDIKIDVAVLKANQDNFKTSIDKIPDLLEDMATVKANQNNMKEQLSKIDGTQKAQLWSLIILVLGTIGTLAVALFKMK